MGKLSEHYGCPNPVRWGCSPIKTVYIRDVEDGKVKWKPVGFICTGCGVFRSKRGWYPPGVATPICEPWMPSKAGEESPPFPIEPEEPAEDETGPTSEDQEVFANTFEAHVDYGGPGKPLEIPDQSRVTIPRLQRALGLSKQEILSGIESGEIPVKKDQYRHWSVPWEWLEGKREARHAEV